MPKPIYKPMNKSIKEIKKSIDLSVNHSKSYHQNLCDLPSSKKPFATSLPWWSGWGTTATSPTRICVDIQQDMTMLNRNIYIYTLATLNLLFCGLRNYNRVFQLIIEKTGYLEKTGFSHIVGFWVHSHISYIHSLEINAIFMCVQYTFYYVLFHLFHICHAWWSFNQHICARNNHGSFTILTMIYFSGLIPKRSSPISPINDFVTKHSPEKW